jgi:hypothetical protein
MATRTLTNEQILSRFGSIEAYHEFRNKVSAYRKNRRIKKSKTTKKKEPSKIISWLKKPLLPDEQFTNLHAILIFTATLLMIVID